MPGDMESKAVIKPRVLLVREAGRGLHKLLNWVYATESRSRAFTAASNTYSYRDVISSLLNIVVTTCCCCRTCTSSLPARSNIMVS
jgi:hypothetical protein